MENSPLDGRAVAPRGSTHSTRRMVALTAAIIAGQFVIVDLLFSTYEGLSAAVDLITEACALTATAAAALWPGADMAAARH